VIGAAVLVAATYFGLLRIAEAKNEAAVGSQTFPLIEPHRDELAAFWRLTQQLETMGQKPLVSRLDELRAQGRLWIAPGLGDDRWAVFVQSLGLVRRIYIRRLALLEPQMHLYPRRAPDIPAAYQTAFAWACLGGALRHELAHYDGALDEAGAYRQELAWYEEVRLSPFFAAQQGEAGEAWKWALESAVLSARKAAETAGS
jgi:hypothetical protein